MDYTPSTKRGWLLSALGILILACMTIIPIRLNQSRTRLADPVVQGQPVSVWVSKALQTANYPDTQKLRELGPDVVPYLAQALKRRSNIFNTLGEGMAISPEGHSAAFSTTRSGTRNPVEGCGCAARDRSNWQGWHPGPH